MTDRNTERGEQRKDERDPRVEQEPQEDAQPNFSRSEDDRGRDKGRPGSDSNRTN